MAIRIARGYRTISYEAACVVSGCLPWALTSDVYAELYRMRVVVRRGPPNGAEEEEEDDDGGWTLPDQRTMRRVLRAQGVLLRQRKVIEWQESLPDSGEGCKVAGAIRPILPEWIGRKHGPLTYRLVQVLTGHRCFGVYLHRIGREETPACWHCEAPEDTARHTLESCPA